MKNLTKDYFEVLDFIPKLLRYFALSPDNRVTCNAIVPTTKITYYRDDDGKYHRVVDLGWKDDDYEPMDFYEPMELSTVEAIISQLEVLPATMPNCGFKNMKDQVTAMSTAYGCLGGF